MPFYPREVGIAKGGLSCIEWVRETFGGDSYQFLYEVHNGYHWFSPNVRPEDVKLPIVSKAQIILSVWHGITAFLKGIIGGNTA